MNKPALYLITFIVLICSYGNSFGQLSDWNTINFDSADTLWPHVIIIDTVHYHHNQWQVGRPQKTAFDSARSFANALVTDTANAYAPNDTSVFFIGFPGHLPGHSWVIPWIYNFNFMYKLNTDTTSIALIEFSADTGKTWIILPDSVWGGTEGDTLVNDSKWQNWHFNMNYLYHYPRTDSLLFRFTFTSGNDTMSKDGWMIDDIHVDYYWEGVTDVQKETRVTIYPNPVADYMNVNSANVITDISISNMVGQIIYAHKYNVEHVHVNTSGFPPGMYFLKVNNGLVKKFVKQ
jgi:Secretion system C-terminal sorting domain